MIYFPLKTHSFIVCMQTCSPLHCSQNIAHIRNMKYATDFALNAGIVTVWFMIHFLAGGRKQSHDTCHMWRGTNKLQPEGWVQSTLRTIGCALFCWFCNQTEWDMACDDKHQINNWQWLDRGQNYPNNLYLWSNCWSCFVQPPATPHNATEHNARK